MNEHENLIVNRLRELTEDGDIEWKAEGLSFPGYIDFKSKIGPPVLIVEVRTGGPITNDSSDHWIVIHQNEEGDGTRVPEKAVVIEPNKGVDMLVEEILKSTFEFPENSDDNKQQNLEKILDILYERFPL